MDVKKLFDKYYSKLEKEAYVRALFSGLVVGFVVNFIVAFVFWFLDAEGLWWSIGSFFVSTASASVLFFRYKYKPTDKQVAARLDRLGLQERMITMNELIDDDSVMALKQREDAKLKLNAIDLSLLKFVFSKAIIIALCIVGVMGIGMTTVTGLSDAGVISSGKDVIDQIIPDDPVVLVTLSYVADEGGMIEGDEVQTLELGSDGTDVIAVAEDGWMFVEWSDGVTDPYRCDYHVEEDTEFIATFAQIGDGEGDGDGEGEGEGESGQEGQPGSGDQPGKSDEPSDKDGPPNNGANGSYTENNMVLDGDTYYRDVFEEYYNQAMEYLANGEDIPAELRTLIQTYFDVIL
ncbi:MAG: hypothetical protein IKA72_01195 [Clostridia bacterium]|nr:hypothetical protein [Clostridia bacterium]